MNNFLILLHPEKLKLYEHSNDGKATIVPIKGEEEMSFDKNTYSNIFKQLKEEILGIFNMESFVESKIGIIYDDKVESNLLKNLYDIFFPCMAIQVISIQNFRKLKDDEKTIKKLKKKNKKIKKELKEYVLENQELNNEIEKLEEKLTDYIECSEDSTDRNAISEAASEAERKAVSEVFKMFSSHIKENQER